VALDLNGVALGLNGVTPLDPDGVAPDLDGVALDLDGVAPDLDEVSLTDALVFTAIPCLQQSCPQLPVQILKETHKDLGKGILHPSTCPTVL
jgi:F420-0:gamma-glutamyl ligase